MFIRKAVLMLSGVLAATGAHALVTVAGTTYADAALVNSFIGSSGAFSVSPTGSAQAQVITDSNVSTGVIAGSGPYIDLGWTQGLAVNGVGTDIDLYSLTGGVSLNTPGTFQVTVNGVVQQYTSAGTGYTTNILGFPFQINRVSVDLTSFSVASGAGISSLRVTFFEQNAIYGPSLSLVAASNFAPLPEPGRFALLAAGLGVVGLIVRRRSLRKA